MSELVSYSPRECTEEISEAFRRGLVDELVVSEETVAGSIAEHVYWFESELERLAPAGIQDTVDELQHWECFSGD